MSSSPSNNSNNNSSSSSNDKQPTRTTATSTDNIDSPPKYASKAENTKSSERGSTAITTTWEEVERTKTRVRRQRRREDEWNVHKFCLMDKNYIHAKEFSNSRSYPVVGKLSCLHYMSESMARATLKARREAASVDSRVQVSWADVWYARWLFRWEVVTILGNENIKRYGEQPDKRAPTDMLARAVIADDDERARLFQVTPMDEAVVKWRDGAGAFVLRMLKPGVDMGKKYMESWENGRQQKLLEKFWDSTVKMDGLKLAAKMASSIVKGWNEVPDDTDDNRKKT